jgi:hypothetical protein
MAITPKWIIGFTSKFLENCKYNPLKKGGAE